METLYIISLMSTLNPHPHGSSYKTCNNSNYLSVNNIYIGTCTYIKLVGIKTTWLAAWAMNQPQEDKVLCAVAE